MTENIIPHSHQISRPDREERNQHRSRLIWFTGLSGSGKSTLADALEVWLFARGIQTFILDGDNIRNGLNSDLDFSSEHRKENIRRIAEVGNLFVQAGVVVLTAFISPFKKEREFAKNLVGTDNYTEVYVECSLEECERRDVKGLYKKARAGKIPDFTGISSPFEVPDNPDIKINTEVNTLDKCLDELTSSVFPKIKLSK